MNADQYRAALDLAGSFCVIDGSFPSLAQAADNRALLTKAIEDNELRQGYALGSTLEQLRQERRILNVGRLRNETRAARVTTALRNRT